MQRGESGSVSVCVGIVLLSLLWSEAVSGQLYRFGKNKVQYEEFDWQRMETAHFDLYFYAEETEFAQYAAHMAEEGFRLIEAKSGHTVQRRIPLIVYSSHVYFEQTNVISGFLSEGVAGFTEHVKGRVALPLSGSLPEFERVLHHELVHVFMFDRIRKVLRSRGITDFRPGPLWFSEGLAEHWSGPWDSQGDMVIRDALFADRLVPVAQMYRIYGSFQMYKEGQSICEYMSEHYGKDVFERLLANWWRGETFEEVFQATTGEPLSKLDEGWLYQTKKNYLPDIQNADPPSQMSTLLTKQGINLKPAIRILRRDSLAGVGEGEDDEADSLEVLFFRNHRGHTHIAGMPLSGGEPKVIVEGERSTDYESLHALSNRLDVSGDGKWLVFSAKRNGRDHLYIYDVDEKEVRQQLTFGDLVSITSPSWSPDATRIVFAGADRGGLADLYAVQVATGELTRLTDDLYHDRDPDWHPVDDRIVFSSDRWSGGRRGFYNLFQYDPVLGEVTTLTRGEHNDRQPKWSPGGDRVAFSSDRGRMYDIFALAVPDSGLGEDNPLLQRFTNTLTAALDPEWLPDEEGLLFTGYERGRFNLYRLDFRFDDDGAQIPNQVAASYLAFASSPGDATQEMWHLQAVDGTVATSGSRYKSKLSLDVAQSQVSQDPIFGTSGGIQIGMSDVLGNDQYFFVLSHISGSDVGFLNGLNFVFGRLHLGRQLNVGWGVFRLNDRFSGTFGRSVSEQRTGGYLELSYPFSQSNRLETRMMVRRADIDRQFEGHQLKAWLMSNYISFTHDSSFWIPTGPLEGTRYSFGLGQNVDFKSSRRFSLTLFGDYRKYLRLGQRSAFAVRYMGRTSRGEVPEFFSLGGSWTLRGYPWRSIWGRNLVLANHELRFPLLDRLVVGLPFGNIDFSSFRGALFADAGNAWNDSFGDWKGSLGMGTRMALGGVFVFRLDASRRTDFNSVGNKTRWDFFFGWDF
jgi:hypothetical protein